MGVVFEVLAPGVQDGQEPNLGPEVFRIGGDLLQGLADHYPEPRGSNSNGAQERTLARATLATLMQILQRIQADVAAGRYSEAAGEYLNYRKLSFASAPAALQAADPSSLFAQ